MRPTGAVPRLSSTGTTPPATQFARGTDRSASNARTITPSSGVKISNPNQSGSIPRAAESGAIPRQGVGAASRTPTPGGTPPLARQGTPAPGQTSPSARPPTLQPGQTSPLAPRPPTLQPGQTSPTARPKTLQPGQTSPTARPKTLQPGQPSPVAPRPPTLQPGQTSPLARPSTPGQSSQIARQPTPAPGQTSPLARQPTPAPGLTSPLARSGTPPAAQNFNPPTQRGFQSGSSGRSDPPGPPAPSSTNFNVATQRGIAPTQPTQPLQRAGGNFDETAALNEALSFMEQRNWTAARQCLHALAAKVPQSKQYRALLCYARGREAHGAGRGEEALLEYQRALQLDPDLAQVKQAVGELQRRR
jgi:hypothetical protein